MFTPNPYRAMRIKHTQLVVVLAVACSLTASASQLPNAVPVITYPVNETIDSFQPTVGFYGAGHDNVEISVWQTPTAVKTFTVPTESFSATCPTTLLPNRAYSLKLRLHNPTGWSPFSKPVTFRSPGKPVVQILSPVNAGHLRGPSTAAKWRISSATAITDYEIFLDNKALASVDTGQTATELNNLTPGLHTLTVKVASREGSTTVSSVFNVYLTPQQAGVLYYYDLSYVAALDMNDPAQKALQYDICNAVAAVQGLANRNGQRLFVKLFPSDDQWLDILRQPGSWLERKTIQKLPSGVDGLIQLFETFRNDFDGSVIWDPDLPSTSNVAATVAGCEDLIPLRYDPSEKSVYSRLIKILPPKVDLRNRFTGSGTIWQTSVQSTGSKKCDAYTWAVEKYLKTGKCNPGLMLYSIDGWWLKCNGNLGHQLVNRDYIIKNKGFVFDLSVWDDEKPVDDPDQPLGADVATLKNILLNAARRHPGMVHMVGFVPWPFKYTNWQKAGGKHEPVPSEWECAQLISDYNTFMDADTYGPADVTNCSLYSRFPLPDRLAQNPRLSVTDLRKQGYLAKDFTVSPMNYLNIYLGDYDAGAWVVQTMLPKWSDPHRNDTPLSWAMNPNHLERVGAIYEYLVRTRTPMETFIAGDSGAGYTNVSRLLGKRVSGLPPAGQRWLDHNLRFNRQAGIKHTGFLLNGKSGPITPEVEAIYTKFSPDGYWTQGPWNPQGDHLYRTMPGLLQQRDLTHDPAKDASIIGPSAIISGPNFLNYRTILIAPTYIYDVAAKLRANDPAISWALLDAPTYASLASARLGHIPDGRATYTFDTIPSTLKLGKLYTVSVGVRNDGWKTWHRLGRNFTGLHLQFYDSKGSWIRESQAAIPADVGPSEGAIISIPVKAPFKVGVYTIRYELKTGDKPFSALGDYAWEKTVTVVP